MLKNRGVRKVTFSDVKVEEIHVQDSLNATSDDWDFVDKVRMSVSPVPVDNVQRSEENWIVEWKKEN